MKVFYYSELLDKSFDTEQACLNAEKAYQDTQKEKQLAKNAVEVAKENVRKAERKLQEVRETAQELYDKRIADAEKEFENAVSTEASALVEAKRKLKIATDKCNEVIPEGKVFGVGQNKLWEDLRKEVRNGSLWDLFTY